MQNYKAKFEKTYKMSLRGAERRSNLDPSQSSDYHALILFGLVITSCILIFDFLLAEFLCNQIAHFTRRIAHSAGL